MHAYDVMAAEKVLFTVASEHHSSGLQVLEAPRMCPFPYGVSGLPGSDTQSKEYREGDRTIRLA